jgi:phosphatidylglycerophosphatase A
MTETGISAIVGLTASAIFGLGVWAAGRAERLFGCRDPGPVVVDEVVGQMVTLLAWPGASWKVLLAGLALFRFFDVVKPFPAGRAEHLPGGWGIMTDDVVAGIYSMASLSALRFVLK